MLKHRGFPGRLPGTDFQFTIRRANKKDGATKIVRRERFRDRKQVVPAEDPFDPCSYEALLRIDRKRAEASFPEVFAPDAPDFGFAEDDWDDGEE